MNVCVETWLTQSEMLGVRKIGNSSPSVAFVIETPHAPATPASLAAWIAHHPLVFLKCCLSGSESTSARECPHLLIYSANVHND